MNADRKTEGNKRETKYQQQTELPFFPSGFELFSFLFLDIRIYLQRFMYLYFVLALFVSQLLSTSTFFFTFFYFLFLSFSIQQKKMSQVPNNANDNCVGPNSSQAGKAKSCEGCPNQNNCASGKGVQNESFPFLFFPFSRSFFSPPLCFR